MSFNISHLSFNSDFKDAVSRKSILHFRRVDVWGNYPGELLVRFYSSKTNKRTFTSHQSHQKKIHNIIFTLFEFNFRGRCFVG